MSFNICLAANTFYYPKGGGHLWVYLNWALGFQALGCKIIWLEHISPDTSDEWVQKRLRSLKNQLKPFNLDKSVALCSRTYEPISFTGMEGVMEIEEACDADLLFNMAYGKMPSNVIERFKRSSLLDIDPGLTQVFMSKGKVNVAHHDIYFTIGETVGHQGAMFPDVGVKWQYTPPCVSLEWWRPHKTENNKPFTTVSHWWGSDWMYDENGIYQNNKRSGFLPFIDLPMHTNQSMELALCLKGDDKERLNLKRHGWYVREAHDISSTLWDYQHYIQNSRGEFSCVKPSCVHLQNAWISDRTLCYLASAKPAVVQHTGPSCFLPDSSGLFRFHDLKEAASCLEAVVADYDRQCKNARLLAEEYFDAKKVAKRVLEVALT